MLAHQLNGENWKVFYPSRAFFCCRWWDSYASRKIKIFFYQVQWFINISWIHLIDFFYEKNFFINWPATLQNGLKPDHSQHHLKIVDDLVQNVILLVNTHIHIHPATLPFMILEEFLNTKLQIPSFHTVLSTSNLLKKKNNSS